MKVTEEMIKQVEDYLKAHEEESLQTLIKVASQPSVSAQDVGVEDCCQLLTDLFASFGVKAQILESPTKPAVFAQIRSKDPKAKTVLFYGHYDVQPADPVEKWNTPPFEPTLIDGTLYGRGVADNKGQFLPHILVAKAYLELFGDLPINMKFILDGEEESGSPGMPQIAEKYRELLAADLMYVSDGGIYDDTTPFVSYGVRGIYSFEIDITTGTTDSHSGNKGGVIDNAAWKMVKLLSRMEDEDGHVLIPGFYDSVIPPSAKQLEMVEKLDFKPEDLAKLYGVEQIKWLDKNEHYKHLMFLPTLTINGFGSGYTGPGSKTIIPCHANVKMDVRLVQGMKAKESFELVKKFVEETEPLARIELKDMMEPSTTDPALPIMRCVEKAAAAGYGKEAVATPVLGGSLPNYVFTDILGMPVVSVPYANPDENNHAPNENIKLWCYYAGIRTTARFLYEVSNMED